MDWRGERDEWVWIAFCTLIAVVAFLLVAWVLSFNAHNCYQDVYSGAYTACT